MTYRVAWSNIPGELAEDFLSVPAKLYSQKTIQQNMKEEREILYSTHPLSRHFSNEVVVVYDGNEPLARALITFYQAESQAYIGYYECINSSEVSKLLFDEVTKRVAEHEHIAKIIGPYNASFWLRYRLKLDQFDQAPYMGEPCNKSYYKEQFVANGYVQTQTYVSNEYKFRINPKLATEYNNATRRANQLRYVIKSPKKREFTSVLSNAYELFSSLYSDFPGYQTITKQEFIDSFQGFQDILNYSFVKFAYLNDELAGFAVAFPDYGNLLYRPMTKLNTLRILLRRFRARRYIIIYLGVLPQHAGLSKALVRPLIVSAILRGAKILGALALEDKKTASYAKSLIGKQYTYGLFEKNI